jgi:hypothetical protein
LIEFRMWRQPASDPELPVDLPRAMTALQRQPSVVVTSWVHAGWHEAVIDSPGSDTATTTAFEGAAVIQRGRSPVAVSQLAFGGLICIDLGSVELTKGVGASDF